MTQCQDYRLFLLIPFISDQNIQKMMSGVSRSDGSDSFLSITIFEFSVAKKDAIMHASEASRR